MDVLTEQIVLQIERLPARKKAAVLELLRSEAASQPAPSAEDVAAWKEALLNTSAWPDVDVEAIEETRAWINQWRPKSF